MSSFTQGLKDKIEGLRDEKEELEDSISRIDAKIETLEELLTEEEDAPEVKTAPKRKRGRPKGSKKKTAKHTTPNAELYDEAVATLPEEGTTPEMQEKLVNRYRPSPRIADGLGPGIRAGTREDTKSGTTKSNKTISIEDD